MLSEELKKFSNEVSSKIHFEYDLKKSNWFNIGGKAKIFFKPDNLPDLILFLKRFGSKEKIYILGAGSNTLISDNRFDGAVIRLGKNFSNISILPNGVIVAGSACLDKKLSDFALENEIGSFEFLACIPGTVGGGLKMNAGCFNKEFKDILISIQAIDKEGRVLTIPANKVIFTYRSNDLADDLIFLSASFKGEKKDKDKIKKEVDRELWNLGRIMELDEEAPTLNNCLRKIVCPAGSMLLFTSNVLHAVCKNTTKKIMYASYISYDPVNLKHEDRVHHKKGPSWTGWVNHPHCNYGDSCREDRIRSFNTGTAPFRFSGGNLTYFIPKRIMTMMLKYWKEEYLKTHPRTGKKMIVENLPSNYTPPVLTDLGKKLLGLIEW